MMELRAEDEILDSVVALDSAFIERARSLLEAASITSLAERYRVNQQEKSVSLGFNPFALISEVYHRENFHSDVLAAILDPCSSHGQGALFLTHFIAFLRDRHEVKIEPSEYSAAIVKREQGRIDVLIYNPNAKRGVIVENKINGAPDMDRQVIRYLEWLEARRYQCDAIVYLTLDSIRYPDMGDWSPEDRERVGPLLKPIAAFRDTPDDLCHGWLRPCVSFCSARGVAQVIQHYTHLIFKLGRNAMNKPLLEEFYQLMLNSEKNKAAISLQSMLAELPKYRATRIIEVLNARIYPFAKAWLYDDKIVVVEGIESVRRWKIDSYLKLHVACEPTETVVSFWNNKGDPTLMPDRILGDLGIHPWFPTRRNNWPSRAFRFPGQEADLTEFLLQFLNKLGDYEGISDAAA